jgi:hypothetical protein
MRTARKQPGSHAGRDLGLYPERHKRRKDWSLSGPMGCSMPGPAALITYLHGHPASNGR